MDGNEIAVLGSQDFLGKKVFSGSGITFSSKKDLRLGGDKSYTGFVDRRGNKSFSVLATVDTITSVLPSWTSGILEQSMTRKFMTAVPLTLDLPAF